jgi:putative transposase
MPRANRYILPGRVCHLTHRCHNRSFLFRFARDRKAYRDRLRAAVNEMRVSLLAYCITSNHVHLLVETEHPELVSKFMRNLEGEFAEYYNRRKKRSGAFWQGRYWCTMVDNNRYLWDCMKYIDLNMIRAGVVAHPSDWEWCGFREIVGDRKRYCLLDNAAILRRYGDADLGEFRSNYRYEIDAAIASSKLARDPIWTESIAVGCESFVKNIESVTENRTDLIVEAH